MDITYIPMARGFVYLAVVLDWFSRRVLSWRVSITMEAAFCIETLEDALAGSRCYSPISNVSYGSTAFDCAAHGGTQDEFTLAAIAQNLRRLAKLVARSPPTAAACVA
jgi:transposase InsO family protein